MDEQELTDRLYKGRNEAFLVEQIALPADEPAVLPARCHENVDGYVARHAGCHPVRGWLIGHHGFFLYFNAHSIVETQAGRLIDITPSHPVCPFLPHPGSDEEFAAIIALTPRLMHQLPSEEWPDLSNLELGTVDPVDE